MGDDKVNIYPKGCHLQGDPLELLEFGCRVHKGNDNIDVTLAAADETTTDDLIKAAVSQSVFDTAAGNEWGTDYSNLAPVFKSRIRALVNRLAS